MPISNSVSIGLLLCLHALAWGQEVETNNDDAELKRLIKGTIDLVSPCVVRFAYGEESKYQFGCGVVVSQEGHIAISGPVHAIIDDDLLELRLANGHVVRGQALGWSSEFGLGMLKITDSGPWPHVKISSRPKVGEVCIALGYVRNTDHKKATRPDVDLGLITKFSSGGWLTTSHRSEFNAHPVFDLHGELIGLCTDSPVNGDPIHANATLITDHWDDFVAGKNLDRVRLFYSNRLRSSCSKGISNAALGKAKLASVRISGIGEKESWASGTIVTPDGYIVTCGHHNRMPGEKLRVLLHDGRSSTASVLGTNLVSDIGVLKIEEKGPWPHVGLGHSAAMKIGDNCILVGYPRVKEGLDPWVYATEIIKPSQTLPRRDECYREFWTKGYPDSIQGASGGGVFDTHGNVVAVLIGGVDDEMKHSRVELFHKNWNTLTAGRPVELSKSTLVEESSDTLKRLTEEFSVKDSAETR